MGEKEEEMIKLILERLVLLLLMSGVVVPATAQNNALKKADQQAEVAVRSFLNIWLVDRDVKRATGYLSTDKNLCAPTEMPDSFQLTARSTALTTLRKNLRRPLKWMSRRKSLSAAISAFPSDRQSVDGGVLVNNSPEFRLFRVTERVLNNCKAPVNSPLYEAVFTFGLGPDRGAGMYFVFHKEREQWRIVLYDWLAQ
ncbi:MAG: hypothetical protein U0Y68_10450 [Blastocatellia bacterium]